MTGVILNADDHAMTRGISQAIFALAEAGRLSSTSAIVTTGHWPADARAALRLRGRPAVGLHLNLTFGAPLGRLPRLAPEGILPLPNAVIRRAIARLLDRAEIAAEIERLLDRFEAEARFPPDFVDGHHHMHALPGIRDELVAGRVAEARTAGGKTPPHLRHMIMCHPGLLDDERGDDVSVGRRRPEEYAFLSRREDTPALIWRPQRATDASGFPW